MATYIGNCADLIDWKKITAPLDDIVSDELYNADTMRLYENHFLNSTNQLSDFLKDQVATSSSQIDYNLFLIKEWSSKYRLDTIGFSLYRPGKHYDATVDNILIKLLGGNITTTSISRLDPGYNVPIHEDYTNIKEPNYDPNKKVCRYVIFITPPETGQFFTLGDECFHNIKIGEIYKWDRPQQLHCAANASYKINYLYHLQVEY